jgi:chitodextrinase
MNMNFSRRGILAVVLTLVVAAGGCMKKQETPSLTGPSELGTGVSVTVTPDILTQDGGSQSLVTVSAFDQNGKPLRNLSLRSEIVVGGVVADFGTLSARSIVTGSDGRATLVYTAPAAPAGPAVDNGTTVSISVTPLGTDFANSFPRIATIRLVPPNVVVPPDGLQPAFTFTPGTAADHETVLFDATASKAPGNNPIVAYSWDFGDGRTGSGSTQSHAFDIAGTYVVRLTVSDAFNRSASISQTVIIGAGNLPAAGTISVSPTPVHVSTPANPVTTNVSAINFKAATGRTIRTYEWNFGDGTFKTASSSNTTHDWLAVGSYVLTFTVTDDAGRSVSATTSVTVIP